MTFCNRTGWKMTFVIEPANKKFESHHWLQPIKTHYQVSLP